MSENTGSVTREISELSVWFSNVYENDNKGMHETWPPLVVAMENCSIGATRLEAMDSYKVALPSTLTSTNLALHYFLLEQFTSDYLFWVIKGHLL